MNLSQAYQGWQQQSQNRELYAKTREAFRKAWFTLPTNKPCSYYTKQVFGEALASTREIESNKAKAASVMVHVLTFANWAEPKFNPMPDFDYNDLMEYTKGPLAQPSDTEGTGISCDVPAQANVTEVPVPDVSPAPESGTTTEESETKNEEDMEQKKQRGKQPKPVAQIDPNTLQVIKVWPSMSQAANELGINHVDVAVAKLCKCGGFYWNLADDTDTFKERLEEKQRQAVDRHKQQAAAMREKKASAQPKPKPEKNIIPPNTPVVTAEPASLAENVRLIEGFKRKYAVSDALAVFTDDELLEELDRRGWQGELRRVQVISIGKDI